MVSRASTNTETSLTRFSCRSSRRKARPFLFYHTRCLYYGKAEQEQEGEAAAEEEEVKEEEAKLFLCVSILYPRGPGRRRYSLLRNRLRHAPAAAYARSLAARVFRKLFELAAKRHLQLGEPRLPFSPGFGGVVLFACSNYSYFFLVQRIGCLFICLVGWSSERNGYVVGAGHVL